MKKLTALLLAVMMLCSVAFAETSEVVESTVTVDADQIVNFSLTMDEVPEGYTFDSTEVAGTLVYTLFNSDDDTAPQYIGTVSFSEEFDGYTLNIEALSEAELEQMKALCGEDWNNPTFTFAKTSHGTDLIIVNENGAESDYVDVFTIYQGYFITVSVLKIDGEIEQADIDGAVKALSDLWIVE